MSMNEREKAGKYLINKNFDFLIDIEIRQAPNFFRLVSEYVKHVDK